MCLEDRRCELLCWVGIQRVRLVYILAQVGAYFTSLRRERRGEERKGGGMGSWIGRDYRWLLLGE